MARSTSKFFHIGTDVQNKSDISVDLYRLDEEKMSKWTPEQKQKALEWIQSVDNIYQEFRKTVIENCK